MSNIWITKENLLYEELSSIVIVFASINIAFDYKRIGTANYKQGDVIWVEGLSSGKYLLLPVFGPVEVALQNLKPDGIQLTIENLEDGKRVTLSHVVNVLESTIGYLACGYFIRFYENNIDKLISLHGKEVSKWPESHNSWKVGWVVRNALSHNNHIFYKNLNTPSIVWYRQTLSPELQGKPIKELFSFADIVLLMLDMEKELN